MNKIYEKSNLEPIVKESFSLAEVLRKLGRRDCGGNYKTLQKYIDKYNLDTSHFTGQTWNKGKSGEKTAIIPLDQILKENTNYKSSYLKDRLIKAGLKEYKCEICGNTGEWQGKPMTLELHHINGNHYDNRLENIQILCLPCHSQTDSYRKHKENLVNKPEMFDISIKERKCENCGKVFKPQRKQNRFCSRECYAEFLNKQGTLNKNCESKSLLILTKENLKNACIKFNNITEISKYFNISRTTIRKKLEEFSLLNSFKEKYDYQCKKVLQFDINNNFIQEWDSITEAEKALHICQIGKVCKGERKTAGGYIWKFKEN